ncbi:MULTISPECIES: hypothetical protein [unclassified Nonomuraea]|uniref:hypothetical protein n=1 Tax=unclassified Nonomuraea TaxID=2593643 RepID=UPI00340B7474
MVGSKLLDLPSYTEGLLAEVDVFEGQAEQLVLPQPARGPEYREQLEESGVSVD